MLQRVASGCAHGMLRRESAVAACVGTVMRRGVRPVPRVSGVDACGVVGVCACADVRPPGVRMGCRGAIVQSRCVAIRHAPGREACARVSGVDACGAGGEVCVAWHLC